MDRLGSPGDKGPENGSETADRGPLGLLPLLAQWGCCGGRRWRWMWG